MAICSRLLPWRGVTLALDLVQIGLSRRVALVAPSVENTRRQGARRTSHSPDEPGKSRVALTEQ
jgi:hypothetical protein